MIQHQSTSHCAVPTQNMSDATVKTSKKDLYVLIQLIPLENVLLGKAIRVHV